MPELVKIELHDSRIPEKERESRGYHCWVAISSKGAPIVTVKTRYGSRGACHAQVWLYGTEHAEFGCGYGKATGYGYCKQSTAVALALVKAGVEINNLMGTGQVREAVEMIAKELNPDFLTIVETWH